MEWYYKIVTNRKKVEGERHEELNRKKIRKELKIATIIALCTVLIPTSSFIHVYAAEDSGVNYYGFIATPTERDIVNGVEVSENLIQPMDVIVIGFDSYTPNTKTHIKKFKKIGTYTLKNSTRSKQSQSAEITKSTAKGSEWSGSVNFTASIKAGILGKIETQVGCTLKQSRSTNEAVGYKASMTVSAKSTGTMTMYYSGWKSAGKLKTYTVNTASPSKKIYTTKDINAMLYKKSTLDIYTTMSEKKN